MDVIGWCSVVWNGVWNRLYYLRVLYFLDFKFRSYCGVFICLKITILKIVHIVGVEVLRRNLSNVVNLIMFSTPPLYVVSNTPLCSIVQKYWVTIIYKLWTLKRINTNICFNNFLCSLGIHYVVLNTT